MKYFILIALCFFLKSQAAKTAFFEDIYSKKLVLCKKTKEISSDKFVDNIIYYKKNNFYYKRIYKHLTPEMFGAKGDGVSDDYKAIQEMLDKGEEGCIFYFDGKKTYYNAFANKGLWIEPLKRNIWQRHKSATFLFNGAKLRRRLPEWNDKNLKGNYNEGQYYTDDHTALLYLTGNNYVIDNADFNSGLQLGNLLDTSEKPTGVTDYAVGTCMEMGLWLDHCKDVTITNSQFTNSVFPVYVTYSSNLKFLNLTLKYAAQANRRINPNDPAIGGGIKLMNSNNIILENVYGYRNLNDTIEIETLNKNITVTGKSDYDYDNSMVIISSQDIKIDWEANNVIHGTGLLIIGANNQLATQNITGKIKVNNTAWCGVLIWLYKDTNSNIQNINLDINTSKTHYTGLYINNESNNYLIKDININHKSFNDGTGTGIARMINNSVEGSLKGTTSKTNTAVQVSGKSSKKPISAKIDVTKDVKLKYNIDKSATLKIL
ncbi:hypothetical protein [Epilithonimonas sp.]|uniref:hypothetical protein n=1 Tax=Epilithonimonas sp. TaxID=2894511 RepID=UPI0028A19B1F|nr:hypothetical protein [Epilithonimonas sp.]